MGSLPHFLKNGGFYGKNNSGNDRYQEKFFGIYALSGINFSLEMGEVHALLGENGAGNRRLSRSLEEFISRTVENQNQWSGCGDKWCFRCTGKRNRNHSSGDCAGAVSD